MILSFSFLLLGNCIASLEFDVAPIRLDSSQVHCIRGITPFATNHSFLLGGLASLKQTIQGSNYIHYKNPFHSDPYSRRPAIQQLL